MWKNPSEDEIRELLAKSRNIAVVGLSPKASRPSHDVTRYMQTAGYRMTGVNPGHTSILGEPCYRSLRDLPADRKPDIVNIFRRSEEAGAHVREAVEIGCPAVWLQRGVIDEAAAEAAAAQGVLVIMDRCIMVDHRRLV